MSALKLNPILLPSASSWVSINLESNANSSHDLGSPLFCFPVAGLYTCCVLTTYFSWFSCLGSVHVLYSVSGTHSLCICMSHSLWHPQVLVQLSFLRRSLLTVPSKEHFPFILIPMYDFNCSLEHIPS